MITTGNDAVILHTLKKNGVVFNIPNTAIITCRLITMEHEVLTSEVVQSFDADGADWSNSLIAVILPATITTETVTKALSWKNGATKAKLETQVDDNGKLTWFESITLTKGTIA